MTKASGGIKSLTGFSGSAQGSGISITSNEIIVGRYGIDSSGKTVSNNKVITGANKPSTWSYSPTWSAVGYASGTNVMKVGCIQTVCLKRGDSKWSLVMANHIK